MAERLAHPVVVVLVVVIEGSHKRLGVAAVVTEVRRRSAQAASVAAADTSLDREELRMAAAFLRLAVWIVQVLAVAVQAEASPDTRTDSAQW